MSPEKQQLRTVIITGGATGIGFETARLLLESGQYRVALIGRSKDRLDNAANELGGVSDRLAVYECDLSDESKIRPTIQRIAATSKGIYGLINNAGIYPFGGLGTTTSESWDETFNVNLKAPFVLIQAVTPEIVKNREGGRIVNIASTAGLLPNHFALAYSVSKAGLVHLTKTLAKELGKDGITVNCICPGIVKSPIHEKYHANRTELEEFYARRGAAYPMGRVGEPADVAGAIKYFLSDEADWVTGEVMVVDGGRLLT